MEVFIFDMDGTMIDSMHFWNNLMDEYLMTKGLKAKDSLMEEILSLTLQDGIVYVKENYGLEGSAEEIEKELHKLIAYNYKNTFDLDKDLMEIFRHLKEEGKKIVLATATQRRLVDVVIERFGLRDFIDLEIVSDEVGLHKNDPSYFENIANHFNMECEKCVVIEDSLYAIESANEAGMKTVAITNQTPKNHIEKMIKTATVSGKNLGEVKEYFFRK